MNESNRLQDCPLCKNTTKAFLYSKPREKYFGFCATCGLRGPESLSREFAIKDWNAIPSRPGPQTAAVLAELVDLLKEPHPDCFEKLLEEYVCVVGISDREAFLREQGVV